MPRGCRPLPSISCSSSTAVVERGGRIAEGRQFDAVADQLDREWQLSVEAQLESAAHDGAVGDERGDNFPPLLAMHMTDKLDPSWLDRGFFDLSGDPRGETRTMQIRDALDRLHGTHFNIKGYPTG